ncbi:MAG TPA: hypothetical protein PJ988_07360 [Anaerolinea sp.]|nr:hypothetical protein [Anaerolinea sp.]
MSEMNICWESLEECQSRRMRGYGELESQTMRELDPEARRLANMALEINQMITELTPQPCTPRKSGYLKHAG